MSSTRTAVTDGLAASRPEYHSPGLRSAEVADAARDTLARLDVSRAGVYSCIKSEGAPLDERPEYWIGLLEGTVMSLLAVIPGEDGREAAR